MMRIVDNFEEKEKLNFGVDLTDAQNSTTETQNKNLRRKIS